MSCPTNLEHWFPKIGSEYNITNYTGIVDYANCVTDNVFGASLPWMVFIVSFMAFSTRYTPLKSIISASYLAWVLCVLMALIGWVQDYMVVIFGIIVAASTAASFWKKKEVG